MDLSSPKAMELRAKVEGARAEMRETDAKQRSAREIAEDGEFRNPDGAFAHRVGTRDYSLAVQKYVAALKAWLITWWIRSALGLPLPLL